MHCLLYGFVQCPFLELYLLLLLLLLNNYIAISEWSFSLRFMSFDTLSNWFWYARFYRSLIITCVFCRLLNTSILLLLLLSIKPFLLPFIMRTSNAHVYCLIVYGYESCAINRQLNDDYRCLKVDYKKIKQNKTCYQVCMFIEVVEFQNDKTK